MIYLSKGNFDLLYPYCTADLLLCFRIGKKPFFSSHDVFHFIFNFRKCQNSGGVYKAIHHPSISDFARREIIQYFIPYSESGEKLWSTGKHCSKTTLPYLSGFRIT